MQHPGVPQNWKLGGRKMNSKMVMVVVGSSLLTAASRSSSLGSQFASLIVRTSYTSPPATSGIAVREAVHTLESACEPVRCPRES